MRCAAKAKKKLREQKRRYSSRALLLQQIVIY